MPSRPSSSFHRLWKYSLALIIIIMIELGLGIADIIIKCPICKQTSYIPAACFALPVWTPVLLIGTSALGLMTGPESSNRNKLLRWCLVLSFISIAVSLVVIGWCVTNIVQSVSTGLLASIGMRSIALAALIIIISLVEVCLFIAFSLNCIDLIDRHSKKGDSESSSSLSEHAYETKAARKRSKQKQWIFANNATLINLPKQPAEEVKTVVHQVRDSGDQDRPSSSSQYKRPTVMELMRTHFHTNKSLLLPSEESPKHSPQPAESEGPTELISPQESYVNVSLPEESETAITTAVASATTTNGTPAASGRRLSGDYDNVVIQKRPFERGNAGARSSFHAIKAFFDGDTHKTPNKESSSQQQKQTVADVHIISNNALMGNSNNTRYSHRDGASEPRTIPKFPNMRLPPAHGKFHGLPGDSAAPQGQAKFIHSFPR